MKKKLPDVDAYLTESLHVFYDGKRYLWDNGSKFVPMDKPSLRSQLKTLGVREIDDFINKVQTEKYVEYAGPIAGKMRGLHSFEGSQLLATSSPQIIPAEKGDYPTIEAFLRTLFGGDDQAETQYDRFMGWMKSGRMAVLSGTRRPGQALVLAGPPDSGKTQLMSAIVIPSLGGRSGKAYAFLSSNSRFNSDLVGAEVLIADDETNDTHLASRRSFGEGIKGALFPESIRMEGKFRDAFSFPLVWRVVIAVNDDSNSLLVLPRLAKDIRDKFMIFRCQRGLHLAEGEFENWRRSIERELPHFLEAVENFIPQEDGAEFGRCGVSSFQHPEIMKAMEALSPETQLLSLIDVASGRGNLQIPWEGTASELYGNLTRRGTPTYSEAASLLRTPQATGRLLSGLAEVEASGVSLLTVRNGIQRYRIDRERGSYRDSEDDSLF